MMPVRSIGHAVLKVRNRARAEAFYHDILGMPIATRNERMTFFTLGNHHDFAVLEVGDDAPLAEANGVGLYHVAFNVGEGLDALRTMKAELEARGVTIDRQVDHTVSQSLYLTDPDGNGVELYVDTSDVWKDDPSALTRRGTLVV
jgi:catechol 2,3-dioxygenase